MQLAVVFFFLFWVLLYGNLTMYISVSRTGDALSRYAIILLMLVFQVMPAWWSPYGMKAVTVMSPQTTSKLRYNDLHLGLWDTSMFIHFITFVHLLIPVGSIKGIYCPSGYLEIWMLHVMPCQQLLTFKFIQIWWEIQNYNIVIRLRGFDLKLWVLASESVCPFTENPQSEFVLKCGTWSMEAYRVVVVVHLQTAGRPGVSALCVRRSPWGCEPCDHQTKTQCTRWGGRGQTEVRH